MKKHRCSVFRRKAERDVYMLLVHEPKGNNIGKVLKKQPAEGEFQIVRSKLAKISIDPKLTAHWAQVDELARLAADLERQLLAGEDCGSAGASFFLAP